MKRLDRLTWAAVILTVLPIAALPLYSRRYNDDVEQFRSNELQRFQRLHVPTNGPNGPNGPRVHDAKLH